MSLIIAVKENDTVFMGADSQSTSGNTRKNNLNVERYKIKKFDNGILLGAVGTLSSSVHLYLKDEWINIDSDQLLTHEYILTQLVNPMYKALEKIKKLEKLWNDVKGLGCSFVIAKDNLMFQISQDGSIIEIPNFVAIGSGSQYVYPYFKYKINGNIRTKLRNALILASTYENSISPPFVFINTKEQTFEIDVVEDDLR